MRWILPVCLLIGVCAPAFAAAPADRPPNVLLLVSDDQRPDTIAALGNAIVQTPHLDTLVRGGTVFVRAVSPNPLCVPARAELMTGMCGLRGGKIDTRLAGKPLWAEAMRGAGYCTRYVGKWHNDGRPTTRGYDETQALYVGGPRGTQLTCPQDHYGRPVTGYMGWVFQDGQGRPHPELGVGLTPDINARIADAAIDFVRRQPERPFFLHVNFTAPHDPLLIPPGWGGRYDPAKIPLPANFRPEHGFDHGNLNGRDERLLATPRTADEVRRELAAYYAAISHMDEQIGRLLAALRETGQAERTIIVFAGDQGLAIGSHGLRGKQNMYDHTIGTPLLLCGPGIPRGKRCPAQCYLRDMFPTVCALAGVPIPPRVEGRSLVPLLRGAAVQVYPCVYGYFGDVQRMIRTDRYKLIHYPQLGRDQLFDLVQDANELEDLSARPEHAERLRDLRSRLDAWLVQRKEIQ